MATSSVFKTLKILCVGRQVCPFLYFISLAYSFRSYNMLFHASYILSSDCFFLHSLFCHFFIIYSFCISSFSFCFFPIFILSFPFAQISILFSLNTFLHLPIPHSFLSYFMFLSISLFFPPYL